MKYIRQFGIILGISFLGELLNYLLPLPVPASIYGLVLMLLALCLGWLRVGDVKETAGFLIEIMPLMFIPAAVGVIESWGMIRKSLPEYIAVTVLSTFAVMVVSGHVTQAVIRREKKRGEA